MAKGYVLDPTTARADDITSAGPDAGSLSGKVIGIRVDQMWRVWDWISEIWAEAFRKAGADHVFHRDSAVGWSISLSGTASMVVAVVILLIGRGAMTRRMAAVKTCG